MPPALQSLLTLYLISLVSIAFSVAIIRAMASSNSDKELPRGMTTRLVFWPGWLVYLVLKGLWLMARGVYRDIVGTKK